MTLALDPGTPFEAFPPSEAEPGLALVTGVCQGRGCGLLHLGCVDFGRDGRRPDLEARPEWLSLEVATGELLAEDAAARALLARCPWLPQWILDHGDVLRRRFERQRAQIDDRSRDSLRSLSWSPGDLVRHAELFPHDFTPFVHSAGEVWLILDACSPDPMDDAGPVRLELICGERRETVTGHLGAAKPDEATATGAGLWKAVRADPELMERLLGRRDEVRHTGKSVVGEAYERARLRAGPSGLTASDAGGYLLGGQVSPALVERLFDVAARLCESGARLADVEYLPWRVETSGVVVREGWVEIGSDDDDDLPFIALSADPCGDDVVLDFSVVGRDGVAVEHQLQRLARGWPLIAGTSVPVVWAVDADGEHADPGPDDVVLAVALAEALLAAVEALESEQELLHEARVIERSVELPQGVVEVRLTASHVEAPWEHEDEHEHEHEHEHEDDWDEDEDDDDDDDDDEDEDEDDEDDPVATALDALFDFALERASIAEARLARRVLAETVGYVRDYTGRDTGWPDASDFGAYLAQHAPRKSDYDAKELAAAPGGLRVLAAWLGSVGHADEAELRAVLDRSVPIFLARVRDPRHFGLAKATFSEMRDAGVDVSDEAQVQAYIALMNARTARLARPAAPVAETAAREPAREPFRRWEPAPGEARPAANDPCPCGRGRRYKKCCMRR